MGSGGYELELTRPWLLLGLLLLPALAYLSIISLVDFSRRQRLVSLLARMTIVVLLVLALSGLTLLTPTTKQFVVFVIDDSLSIGETARSVATNFLQQASRQAAGNEVRFLSFAARPGSLVTTASDLRAALTNDQATVDDRLPGEGPKSEQDLSVAADGQGVESPSRDPRSGSNLAAAIELAAASIPPFYVKQIVLLSDGNQTEGDAVQAALNAGTPVSVVALPDRDEPEVQVSAVNLPAEVRQGEPFNVEVVIDSNHDDQGVIELYRGPHRVGASSDTVRTIKKGENRFVIRETGTDQRLLEYTARIRGFQDQQLDNNIASGLVFTTGKPRVLLIDSDTRSARSLDSALREHDILVEIRPPQGTPRTLAELQNYEVVMLSNVAATDLTLQQMDVLRTYVQDLGGGLIMLGGDQSFGLGGYYKTPLEEILPVRSDIEKEQEKPSLAMVLAVDKSGSMGGLKLELAKDATRSAVELLGSRDQVGIIAFDGASYWVSDLRSAADKNSILSRIGTMEASGGTNIYPALEDAYKSLVATAARLKHVILLTDGHSSPGDFEGISQRMAAARITVSTVAVGGDADRALLESIARIGNGRHYYCDDPRAVPQIFAKETVTASKSALNEEPFLPQVVRPSQALSGIDLDTAPFLLGFVVTRPKPTSEFILATETGEPLLVWWRYGLGMSVAFTSDAKSRWAAEWLTWPDFGKFWAQVIRHAMRKSGSGGAEVQVTRRGSVTEIVLDAVDADGQFRNQVPTRLTVIDPTLDAGEHTMTQIAPGRYATRLPTEKPGTYLLELSQHVQGQLALRQSRGLVVGYPDELRLKPADQQLLRTVAQVSGGRFNPTPAEVFELGDRRARTAWPLWPYLLTLAAILLLVDVALRRIEFTWLRGPLT